MTNREKAIVGLMLLAVVYGVYIVFFAGPNEEAAFKSGGDTKLEALNSFITKVAEKTKSSLPEEQAYALQKAQSDWTQDPLIHIEPKISREEEAQRQPLKLDRKIIYTGFLQMGANRLAIINGLEYEIGDRLEPDGLIIRNIHPNHVVIGSPVHKNKKVILPMEELE
jgi:hypothetical protein